MMARDRIFVNIWKNRSAGGNGVVSVTTNATNVDEFCDALSGSLLCALRATPGDHEYTLGYLLPAIVEIASKLKGYKADTVMEQRLLGVGDIWPTDDLELISSGEAAQAGDQLMASLEAGEFEEAAAS